MRYSSLCIYRYIILNRFTTISALVLNIKWSMSSHLLLNTASDIGIKKNFVKPFNLLWSLDKVTHMAIGIDTIMTIVIVFTLITVLRPDVFLMVIVNHGDIGVFHFTDWSIGPRKFHKYNKFEYSPHIIYGYRYYNCCNTTIWTYKRGRWLGLD